MPGLAVADEADVGRRPAHVEAHRLADPRAPPRRRRRRPGPRGGAAPGAPPPPRGRTRRRSTASRRARAGRARRPTAPGGAGTGRRPGRGRRRRPRSTPARTPGTRARRRPTRPRGRPGGRAAAGGPPRARAAGGRRSEAGTPRRPRRPPAGAAAPPVSTDSGSSRRRTPSGPAPLVDLRGDLRERLRRRHLEPVEVRPRLAGERQQVAEARRWRPGPCARPAARGARSWPRSSRARAGRHRRRRAPPRQARARRPRRPRATGRGRRRHLGGREPATGDQRDVGERAAHVDSDDRAHRARICCSRDAFTGITSTEASAGDRGRALGLAQRDRIGLVTGRLRAALRPERARRRRMWRATGREALDRISAYAPELGDRDRGHRGRIGPPRRDDRRAERPHRAAGRRRRASARPSPASAR